MRRLTTLTVVAASICLLSASQASALGWRGMWRGARQQNHQCCTVTVAPDHAAVSAKTAEPAATTVSKSKVKPAPVAEAAVLAELISAMKAVLIVENERLDRELQWYEDAERTEYGED